MCCCGKPTINGEFGYRWNDPTAEPVVHPVNPPLITGNQILIHDEPGRCGGLDSHAFHYRLVREHGIVHLLVRHGGGDERLRLASTPTLLATLAALDSTARYWIFNALYHTYADGKRSGRDTEAARWQRAAAEKRIRTRKNRAQDTVKVWIVP